LYNYWGSLGVSAGYIAILQLLCRFPAFIRYAQPVAAVGRTALSNYLLQSLLCTFIFYGHGLGWFGQVERTGQVQIVAVVWIVELVLTMFWLRYFRMGPVEWWWRAVTYCRWIPLRIEDREAAA
jgi:uncharacterized protein